MSTVRFGPTWVFCHDRPRGDFAAEMEAVTRHMDRQKRPVKVPVPASVPDSRAAARQAPSGTGTETGTGHAGFRPEFIEALRV
jgi:hypothetical protein